MVDAMKGRHRGLRRCLTVVAALVVLQFASYGLWADRAMIATIKAWFPNRVHFAETASFEFACVEQDAWDALSQERQAIALKILKTEFDNVYIGRDAIPSEKWAAHPEMPEKLAGLKPGGCILSWRFENGFMVFRGEYSDYEAPLAASSTQATYVWILGMWFRLPGGGTEVA